MTEPVSAYPLSWPVGWPRTPRRQRSSFSVSFAVARDDALHELALLGARRVVISSNIPLRRDGLPYAGKGEPDDPAVAVYFKLHGESRCVPADKWDRARDNLRAIGLTVAALRGLDRWGAGEMVRAAFRGFVALPAGGDAGWWSVLGLDPGATSEQVDAAYRRLARQTHPDAGGDEAAFRRLVDAYRIAKEGRA